jgi:hypothetical protein
MKFEEVMKGLREGKEAVNKNWNGTKLEGRILYVTIQKPDEHSLNTEPYFMMHSGVFEKRSGMETGGWVFKRFPWTPSVLDFFSEGWEFREVKGGEEDGKDTE